jgi:hypothetical protein
MSLHAVPAGPDRADEVHGLADRLGATSEKLHHAEHERDRYRLALVGLRSDHADDGAGFCTGDHASDGVLYPCEVRDSVDAALRPVCKRCGHHTEVNPEHLCHECEKAS